MQSGASSTLFNLTFNYSKPPMKKIARAYKGALKKDTQPTSFNNI